MSLFRDPTPRVERKDRQDYGVIVTVSDGPGSDAVGYPATVRFKGRVYGCYAFGDSLAVGSRVHFVEAGGRFWAIQAGDYYKTTFKKSIRELWKKSPATASLLHLMRKNKRKFEYRAGTVLSTGDTATVALHGETAARAFPVEFAGAPSEIAEADDGKKALVFFVEEGKGFALPGAVEIEQSGEGDIGGPSEWPSGDTPITRTLPYGHVLGMSGAGRGGLLVVIWDGYYLNFVSVEVDPHIVYTASSGLPWGYFRSTNVCSVGDYIIWGISGSTFQRLNKVTGVRDTFGDNDIWYSQYWDVAALDSEHVFTIQSGFNSSIYVRSSFVIRKVWHVPSKTLVSSTYQIMHDSPDSPAPDDHVWKTYSWGSGYGFSAFNGKAKQHSLTRLTPDTFQPAGHYFTSPEFSVSSDDTSQCLVQGLSDGRWFSPYGFGVFDSFGGGFSLTDKAGYNAAIADPIADPFAAPSATNYWLASAELWKGSIICPRKRIVISGPVTEYACDLMQYTDGNWYRKNDEYCVSKPFSGIAGVGHDRALYVVETDATKSTPEDEWAWLGSNAVTRHKKVK